MAELTEVVGTILKDVAKSRVTSDLFSRDISLEYAADPILIEFPVPRVEIKQAAIDLKFAVNAIQRGQVDSSKLIPAQLDILAESLGQSVFETLVTEHPNHEKILAILEQLELQLTDELIALLKDVLEDRENDIGRALAGEPAVLSRHLSNHMEKQIRRHDKLWDALQNGLRVRAIQEKIRAESSSAVEKFVQDVKNAAEVAMNNKLGVDIAVTRDELANVAEPILSQIQLTTEIRNYEWNEVGEVDGQPIRRLQPE